MLPPHLAHLPEPPPEAAALGAALEARIRAAIAEAAGWLSFARYMELALYEPGLGYYSAGSVKLGPAGDFVTAPELSPLFARCVARQVAQIVELGITDVVEIGAGSGALAADLLQALAALGRLPTRYRILEVSADLRERQAQRIREYAPELLARVEWLDALPRTLDAVLIGNEVLDAIPTHIVRTHGDRIDELGVALDARGGGFVRDYRPTTGTLLQAARALALPDAYETEINLAARAFVRSFASRIRRGALLFFDYGFPAAELYHPQRAHGTLMCHYRHHAHDDPLVLAGLQDITAHVDFTAIADAALDSGHAVLGYTSLARFLVNCGITGILAQASPRDTRTYAPVAAAANKLTSPAEMGELFKVIALGRGIETPLTGFARGDRVHTL
jgi:SAM-dependent MidA family methyltransferase